jgi:hypothetical protein
MALFSRFRPELSLESIEWSPSIRSVMARGGCLVLHNSARNCYTTFRLTALAQAAKRRKRLTSRDGQPIPLGVFRVGNGGYVLLSYDSPKLDAICHNDG